MGDFHQHPSGFVPAQGDPFTVRFHEDGAMPMVLQDLQDRIGHYADPGEAADECSAAA
jgi:hypothetical protein